MSSPIKETVRRNSESDSEHQDSEHDPHYEPIVSLPLVEVPTNEENEEEIVKLRARLYRYDVSDHEWKERGTGDIKLLHNSDNHSVRVVMRRDKTHKVCANHFITPDIRMNVHCGSDKAFNWSVFADFADETCKQEMLAIKFGNAQNAALWKVKFAEAQEIVRTKCFLYTQDNFTDDEDDDDDESSITRSEDTDTPEPKSCDKSLGDGEAPTNIIDKDTDSLAAKVQDLKVETEKAN